MTSLRVGSYNTLCLEMNSNKPGEAERRDRVVQVIRQADFDVLAVQELASLEALYRLAADTGMSCTVGKTGEVTSEIACDPGNNGFGVGVLWRSGIEAVPGTLRRYSTSGGVYFHGLVKVHLDCGGTLLQAAAGHLTPFGAPQIVTEAKRVVSNLTRPHDRPPGFVGLDSNGITGDRVRRDGRWFWHAQDPYRGKPWFADLVYQCKWRYDEETGQRVHWADRDAGDALWSGGLHEAGAVLDAPFSPTVGYWHDDPFGERDIDHVRVTRELVPAVRSVRVLRSDLALAASDHLPKEVLFDTDLIDPAAPNLAEI